MIDLLIKYFKFKTLEIKLSPTIYDQSTFKNFNSDSLEIRLVQNFFNKLVCGVSSNLLSNVKTMRKIPPNFCGLLRILTLPS